MPPHSTSERKVVWGDLGLILFFGLLVFTWFQPGHLILAEDISIPDSPAQWLRRLYAWNMQMNTGSDFSVSDFPGLLFHGFPAALRWCGIDITTAQHIQTACWFLLPGLAMYYMIGIFVRGPGKRVAQLVAANFYMFNLHLEPVWQLQDIATLSAYGTLPLAIALFADGCRTPEHRSRNLVLLGLVFFVGSGAGINPPVQLVAAAVLPLYLLISLVAAKSAGGSSPSVGGIVGFGCGVALVWVGINAFWILPLAAKTWWYTLPSVGPAAQATSLAWLKGVSANTSFWNVVRFQGHWSWYEGWQEPYHTYAVLYRNNPALIFLSGLAPALVILGMVIVRQKQHLFFTLLTVVGVTFGMGMHPPMTRLYLWCVNHLPTFWAIRSPYYKFGILATLGYAFFIGLMGQRGFQWVRARGGRMSAIAGIALLITCNMAYAFPVTMGKMYATQAERRVLPPNHVQVPSYVWEASRWLDRQQDHGFFRIVNLPSKGWFYDWGLASGRPALLQIGLTPVLHLSPFSLVPTAEQPLLRAFYEALNAGTTTSLDQLTRLLNVRYLLHETDLKYWIPDETARATQNPAFIQAHLNLQTGFTKVKAFGPWEFYKTPNAWPHLYLVPRATLIAGEAKDLIPLTMTELLQTPACLLIKDLDHVTVNRLLRAGAIDSIVLTPQGSLPSELARFEPVTIVVSLDHLSMDVDLSRAAQVIWKQGFDRPVPHPDGVVWRDLTSNNETNAVLANPSTQARTVALSGSIATYGMTRDLYLYLNGHLAGIVTVTPDVPTTVSLHDLVLQPGDNTLALYSPMARTRLTDGRDVNFSLADNWTMGPVAHHGTVQIPCAGVWTATLIPARRTPQEMTPPPTVSLAGKTCVWSPAPTGWTCAIWLPHGPTEIHFADLHETSYTLLLKPQGQPLLAPRPIIPITPVVETPTSYTLPPPPQAGFLVFSEGYHPGWQATQHGRPLPHFPVQGFANGYWVDPGSPIEIRLTLQRWFVLGMAVSITTAVVLGLIAITRWRAVRLRPR